MSRKDASITARATLAIYGLAIAIEGDWPEVVDQVRRDFVWFERPSTDAPGGVTIRIERGKPDFDRFGPLGAAFVTPRNVVYQDDGRTIIDYFGKAISVFDRQIDTLTIQGEDEHLVHEAGYHFLLSRVGQHLDARRLIRVHALGLAAGRAGIVVMLPSGGGKSTLGLSALRDPRVRMLSEDTPLLDASGVLHPFPLRIGVNPSDTGRLPEGSVRRLERMEFHPKLVLDVDAVADRIASDPVPLEHIVIGRRSLGREGVLEPASRRLAAAALLREAVVGVGVYQGLEFVLQRGLRDAAGKLGVLASRAACCAAGLRRARVWQLTLGRDLDRNWAALDALLR
jgi:hypothetical protein